ncbi:MAG: hypothetical protein ACPGVK_09215 [Halocynthiibacter sp.]
MPQTRVVLCIKWGTLYPAFYVNVLHSAVKKHLKGDFRFVCLTNEGDGLHEDIEVFPLPDLDLPEERYRHGAWPKLAIFAKDLYGLTGRCLFIDLDSAIVGDLEPLFEHPGVFNAIGDGDGWRRGRDNQVDCTLASGVFSFDFGSEPQVLDNFMADKQAAYDAFINEQQCIEGHISDWAPWPHDWVISFKRHLRRPLVVDRFLPPLDPPKDTKIVAFHGNPRPIEVVRNANQSWGKFPHYGRGPVGWMRDYFIEHGYSDDMDLR